ncbi:MAG TPA: hypothetical protein VH583_04785 [Vicinamibacterales bacterium]|jgi:hypothetical protein
MTTRLSTKVPRLFLVAALAGVAATPMMIGAQTANSTPLPLPLRLTSFAVNMSNIGTGMAGMVEIRLTKWSTADERKKVITTMVEQGQDKLLSLLQDLPVKGRLRFPNYMGPDPNNLRLGWDIRYAWHTPLPEGGHRIVIAIDRYMSFAEVRNQPRTVDYPFTLIEIQLNKDGQGQGKMAYATKIMFDKKKNTVELENFSTEPVRLNEVKLEKG